MKLDLVLDFLTSAVISLHLICFFKFCWFVHRSLEAIADQRKRSLFLRVLILHTFLFSDIGVNFVVIVSFGLPNSINLSASISLTLWKLYEVFGFFSFLIGHADCCFDLFHVLLVFDFFSFHLGVQCTWCTLWCWCELYLLYTYLIFFFETLNLFFYCFGKLIWTIWRLFT